MEGNPYEEHGEEQHNPYQDYPQPDGPPPVAGGNEKEGRLWAMALHMSMLLGFMIPIAGWVVPIVIWQVQKDEFPELDRHGRVVANWMISEFIYLCICILLVFVVIGIPLLIVFGVIMVIFPLIGGIKANNGEVWEYPGSFRIF